MPTMYDGAVPTVPRALTNLIGVLEKGAAYAEAKKIEPAVLIASRLYPDMFPLSRQVQIASDSAKGGASRLAQVEPPKYEDNEATFAELAARCRKTIAYLESLKPEQFEGAEDRTVTWTVRAGPKSMQGMPYLLTHVTPNVYFHVTPAYAILRRPGRAIRT